MSNLKDKAIFSLLWKGGEKLISQVITLVISIVLARLLGPEEYGLIALTTVFISFGFVFVDCGLGTALVQKNEVTNSDMNTIMICNIVIGVILYGLVFIAAPFIGMFYNENRVVPILRVLSLAFVLGAISAIFIAKLSREFKFKQIAVANILANTVAGILGILAAFYGFGAWALVIQQFAIRLLVCIFLGVQSEFKFIFTFSKKAAAEMLSFAWKITFSRFISNAYFQLRSLIIGKMYSPVDLAYFNKGEQFPAVINTSTDYALQQVMLTVYAKEQSDSVKLKAMMRRSMKLSSFFFFPIMIGLSAVSKNVVLILLGEKWAPSIPFMQLCCLVYVFYPIGTANVQAINAMGRSDITLKTELYTRIVSSALIIVSAFIGLYQLAASAVIASFIETIIRATPNKKLLNYTYREQIKDIAPQLLCAAIMGILVFTLGYLPVNIYVQLLVQLVVGVSFYMLLSICMKNDNVEYLLEILKNIRKK
ncbi:lipopolysaccharide biosynthesis protein [Clostridium sp. AF19-22AC]|jgi:teichuronic acid exporter|uniref:lipopolysaccharide biosynthesis protein n=1 Tax=Clostridia TaxID=186801 RepID=UPI000E4D2F3D|nr:MULTISPECIES: lipopolysaccharide biosynthesis protein [Clostridia]RHR28733.1 lipopolysaccharide biosynthesis protein [Clostridium sp. AF19-22AC]